jgi:hypoxanthine phosphoribosyltransferase
MSIQPAAGFCCPTVPVLYCHHPGKRRQGQPTVKLEVIDRILVDEERVRRRVAELGQTISRDYTGKDLVLTCVLKGGVAFLTDLMREITIPHEIDFMAISSYGVGQRESTGAVRLIMDLKVDIAGRDVIIVEDIVDSGRTVDYLLRALWARQPASLRICTLLNKPSRRVIEVPLDYIGFDIPDEFVLGYGLDFDEKFRNLPYVGVLKKEYFDGLPD